MGTKGNGRDSLRFTGNDIYELRLRKDGDGLELTSDGFVRPDLVFRARRGSARHRVREVPVTQACAERDSSRVGRQRRSNPHVRIRQRFSSVGRGKQFALRARRCFQFQKR
jgi:hypothetical protein